jgi:Glycosyl transferases group 1
VLGMHRGGTSAVTRVINLLGLRVGETAALMPPRPSNPTGFWEVSRLKALNNRLLEFLGADWTCAPPALSGWAQFRELEPLRERARRTFREVHPTSPWVWKDPRNCITLRFWIEVLQVRPVAVVVQRNPLEVCRSLHARDGFSFSLALGLWERYMRGALALAEGLPTLVVRYADLVSRPAETYTAMGAFISGAGLDAPAPAAESAVEEFVSERQRHAVVDPAEPLRHPDLSHAQRELFSTLEALVGEHQTLAAPSLPAESAWTEHLLAERRGARRALRQAQATARAGQPGARTGPPWRQPELAAPRQRTVLFFRHYRRFSGGHLNVWNYFNHVRASPAHRPSIAFTPRSVWTADNPWAADPTGVTSVADAPRPDVLFLEGLDWQLLEGLWDPHRPPAPVINLIQNVKHARPDNVRHQFLRYPAIRICVSQDVAEAIAATGHVNGPTFTIPSGIDLEGLPEPLPVAGRDVDVLVAALKRPSLGRALAKRLERRDRTVELLVDQISRPGFLAAMRRSAVVVFLGREMEGLPLPTLEAMALGSVLVCPPSPGLRHHCRHGGNCVLAGDCEDALAAAVEDVLRRDLAARSALAANARATALRHGLGPERAAFLDLLDNVDDLWTSASAG